MMDLANMGAMKASFGFHHVVKDDSGYLQPLACQENSARRSHEKPHLKAFIHPLCFLIEIEEAGKD